MNKRIWRWLAATILIFPAILLTIVSAGAEKPLMPFVKVDRNYADIRQRGTYTHIEGPQSGVTCQQYQFTVINKDDEDSRVKSYHHVVAILDDIVYPDTADTLYSVETTEAAFCFTFYEPGEYVIFSIRFDSDGKIVKNGSSDNVQKIVGITEGTGTNFLTVAVNDAAAICKKDNEFETAAAINDYLTGLITYDDTKTYYSPQAALLGNHTCVCNGYSRAYKLIADACNLQCKRVSGIAGGGGHAWDVVRINGKWYHVDPTWNDPKVNGSYENNERYWHIYMGLSGTVMGLNHSDFHYPDGASVTCDSLEDNYFVHTGKWEDLAYGVKSQIQDALNAMDGDTGTITADFGNHAYLEVLSDGSRYYTDKLDTLKINGHIVAFALSRQEWTRTNQGVNTTMTGTFTYSYSSTASTLTGIMSSAKKTYDMSGAHWDYTAPFIYDGTDQTVLVTGLPDGVTVKAYTNNTQRNAGTYTAGVTLNYNAAEYMEPVMPDCEWTIQPKPVSENAGVTVAVSEGLVYDGTAKADVLSVKDGTADLTAGTDYTVTYAGRDGTEYASCDTAPANAGNYTATVSFAGNYSGEKAVPFSIGAREVSLGWTNTALTYNGQEQAPTAAAGNLIEGDTCTVTVTGGQTDAGDNYTATASALSNPNYKLPAANTTTFSIGKATFPLAVTQEGWTYGGEDFSSPVIEGLPDGLPRTILYKEKTAADTDYTETVPINAGSYTVKVAVEETANYQAAAATADFTVSPAVLTATFTGSKVYGYQDRMSPGITGWKYQDEDNNKQQLQGQISISREAGEDSGVYTVTLTGPETYGTNYTVTYKPGRFEIQIYVNRHHTGRGSVTVDKQYVVGVQTVTVTAEPDPGYMTEKVTYRYEKENAQDVRTLSPDPESGLYQFQTVIDDNAVVEVTFRPIAYTVAFDANGGSGSMEDMAFKYDEEQYLIPNEFTRANHEFNEWNTAADGSGDAYRDEETVSNLTVQDGSTVTLYAQWLSKCDIEGHHLTAHPRVEATCTTDGTEAYWECTGCGKLFSDANGMTAITEPVIIPAHHTLAKHPAAAPTCTEAGYQEYWECTGCRKLFSDANGTTAITEPVVISAHHTLTKHPAAAPTCTEAGCQEYWECTVCHKLFSDAAGQTAIDAVPVIAAPGHAWGEVSYSWAEDFSAVTAKRVCARDPGHEETETVKPVGTVTAPATEEAEGRMLYTATFTNPAFPAVTKEASIPKMQATLPPAGPYTDPDGTGDYRIGTDGTAEYKAAPANTTKVTIPDSITVNNKTVPVVSIADKAFNKNKKIQTVTIGANIQTIGANAFNGCKALTTIKNGANVTAIGKNAFSGCEKLSKIPGFSGLETIGDAAFKGCKGLTKITLGAKVKKIGKNAFNGCAKLKTITIKTALLNQKAIGKNCFAGIAAKAVFKCPKKQLANYTKWLKKPGGAPKGATFK